MSVLQSLIKALSPLGIYTLTEDSAVYKELCAYACALDIYNDILEEQLCESVIATAESYGLALREKITGAVRNDLTLSQRREMLNKRMSVTTNDFNLDGTEKILASLGLACGIWEYPRLMTLHIVCSGKYTKAQRKWITSQVYTLLPAHLDIVLDFGTLTWEAFEKKNLTFAGADEKNMTWAKIEAYGVN